MRTIEGDIVNNKIIFYPKAFVQIMCYSIALTVATVGLVELASDHMKNWRKNKKKFINKFE